MSRWNGDGGGDGGMYDGDGSMGFGYDSEPGEPAPEPAPPPQLQQPRRQTAQPPVARARRQMGSAPSYRSMGADEMGWVASIVDQYVATPEFISAQLDKIAADPKIDETISKKMLPYYPFMIVAGIAVGAFGAYLIDAWRGATSGKSFVKNIARRLLA